MSIANQDAEKAITRVSGAHRDAEMALALAQDVDGKLGIVKTVVIIAIILSGFTIVGMVFSLVTRRR